SNVQSSWMFAVATLCGATSKSTASGLSSNARGDGRFDESRVLKVIRPEIDEPAEVCTTRSVTSVPSTTTGSGPNSPSTHHGERPRSARMMYCPGGTFGNSNVPSSLSRAPIEMLTGDDDRTLESSVRL